MNGQDGVAEREPLWRWVPVWVAFFAYGVDAGREHGVLGILVGAALSTVVTLGCFGVVRWLSTLMSDESTTVPPLCLRGRCEGYGPDDTPGRYAFGVRDDSGDAVRCGCGDRCLLTPDLFFGKQRMLVLVNGTAQPVARKRVLGPWGWTVGAEVRQHLVERLDLGRKGQSAAARPPR